MVEKLIAENRKRMNLMYASYDPITGENALGDRTILSIKDFSIKKQFVPKPLLDEPLIKLISQHKSIERFAKANKKYSSCGANTTSCSGLTLACESKIKWVEK